MSNVQVQFLLVCNEDCIEQFFQRLEEVKIKSRVFSDYDNSLMVGLSVTYFHPRVIKELSGGKRFIEIREADAHKRFLNHHLL